MSAEGGTRAVVAALLANLGIAVSKLVAFAVTGSSSMLAEAVHSGADCGNQGLLLLGRRAAARPADEEHPFGHGRERYLSAFLVAVVLFSLGGLFAVYEGVEKIAHPHHLDAPAVALAVLGVAIVLEGLSLRTVLREARPQRGDLSWPAFVRQTRSPELPVVLLEDVAALVGLVLALLGVVLALVFDQPRFDGAGTLAIGLLLAAVAVVLGVEMRSLLVGEAATPAQVAAIRRALTDAADVVALVHLRTLHLGPDELLVAAKLALEPGADLPRVARAIDAAEAAVRAAVPSARLVYLEPDLLRPTSTPAGTE